MSETASEMEAAEGGEREVLATLIWGSCDERLIAATGGSQILDNILAAGFTRATRPVPVQDGGPDPALVKWLQGGIEYFRLKGTGEVGEWWSRQIARVFDPARLPTTVPLRVESEKGVANLATLVQISKRIREKGTHGKASYPDKSIVAIADAFDEVLATILFAPPTTERSDDNS